MLPCMSYATLGNNVISQASIVVLTLFQSYYAVLAAQHTGQHLLYSMTQCHCILVLPPSPSLTFFLIEETIYINKAYRAAFIISH